MPKSSFISVNTNIQDVTAPKPPVILNHTQVLNEIWCDVFIPTENMDGSRFDDPHSLVWVNGPGMDAFVGLDEIEAAALPGSVSDSVPLTILDVEKTISVKVPVIGIGSVGQNTTGFAIYDKSFVNG